MLVNYMGKERNYIYIYIYIIHKRKELYFYLKKTCLVTNKTAAIVLLFCNIKY